MNGGTEPGLARRGEKIAHDLLPEFVMTVEAVRPCLNDGSHDLLHPMYQITDPEGKTDWLCSYDVHKAPPS